MGSREKEQRNVPAVLAYSIVGAYAVFGGLWILLSDRILGVLAPDPAAYANFQTYKGWFYVAVTAALLYLLLRLALGAISRLEEARLKTERELLQAQKMELVGRLAGGVAHDFNNVLTAIMGLAQMSASSLPKDDQRRADMEDILKFAERAGAITAQMLAFSRRQIVQPRPLELPAVARDAAKMLRRAVGELVSVDFDLEEAPWPVMADPGQLQQVLMNLAVNARDAMPAGGRLTVSVRNSALTAPLADAWGTAPAGDYALLTVADEGCGMDGATLASIFEPFFTTKAQGKGTGLGLSVVRNIVDGLGGHITVVSRPGKGSVFSVYLPRYTGPMPAETAGGSRPSPLGGSETVLLVDDQPEVLPVLRRMLESKGYAVICAGGFEEAVELAAAAESGIDLLVTDSELPDGTGPDLAAEVKHLRPGTRTLFISGRADSREVRERVIAPGLPFLPKPFTPDTLLAKVRETLTQK